MYKITKAQFEEIQITREYEMQKNVVLKLILQNLRLSQKIKEERAKQHSIGDDSDVETLSIHTCHCNSEHIDHCDINKTEVLHRNEEIVHCNTDKSEINNRNEEIVHCNTDKSEINQRSEEIVHCNTDKIVINHRNEEITHCNNDRSEVIHRNEEIVHCNNDRSEINHRNENCSDIDDSPLLTFRTYAARKLADRIARGNAILDKSANTNMACENINE